MDFKDIKNDVGARLVNHEEGEVLNNTSALVTFNDGSVTTGITDVGGVEKNYDKLSQLNDKDVEQNSNNVHCGDECQDENGISSTDSTVECMKSIDKNYSELNTPEHIRPYQGDAFNIPENASNTPENALNIPENALNIPENALNIPDNELNRPEDALNIPEDALNIPDNELKTPELELKTSDSEVCLKVEENDEINTSVELEIPREGDASELDTQKSVTFKQKDGETPTCGKLSLFTLM